MKEMLSIFVLMLVVVSPVSAHPADRNASGLKHLGTTNVEFKTLHDSYWHERRLLVRQMVEYGKCVGSVSDMEFLLGTTKHFKEEKGVTGYWDVIPANEIVDKPLDFKNAENKIKSALATKAVFGANINLCNRRRTELLGKLEKKVR